MSSEVYWRIALSQVQGIGCVGAQALLRHYGSAEAVFEASAVAPGDFAVVEATLRFVRQHGVHLWLPGDPEYPRRLLDCPDHPILLYFKGAANLNRSHVLSIVGTRTPSDHGKQAVRSLVRELSAYDVLLVSGLADGIDTLVHRYALEYGLPTVGVLAHGLDSLYPPTNRHLAEAMLERGGLLTEFAPGTPAIPGHFPVRNRIVAGIGEATVIVESRIKGGSMVTAGLARGYQREVFAIPGRITDERSLGCLALIRGNAAALVTGGEDVARMLNWEPTAQKARKAPSAHPLLALLRDRDSVHLDELKATSGLTSTELAVALLTLELEQAIDA